MALSVYSFAKISLVLVCLFIRRVCDIPIVTIHDTDIVWI